MKKLHKMMKAFAVCVALALVFCMIPVGSVYAETNAENESGNGSENGGNGGTPGKDDQVNNEDSKKTVQVTIDNTNSHLAVRFYKDTTNIDLIRDKPVILLRSKKVQRQEFVYMFRQMDIVFRMDIRLTVQLD